MNTGKHHKRAQRVVKEIIDAWDPYALLRGGAPDDEFDSEINEIVRQLPHIRSEDDAIHVISMVMSSAFEAKDFTPDKCNAIGKEAFTRCKEEGLIGKRRT